MRVEDGAAIVTPVFVEFLAGVTSTNELKLAKEFLKCFQLLDGHRISPDDWREAIRIAQRVPRNGARRQLGDCLIRAIANRLRADVITYDSAFPG